MQRILVAAATLPVRRLVHIFETSIRDDVRHFMSLGSRPRTVMWPPLPLSSLFAYISEAESQRQGPLSNRLSLPRTCLAQ
jgi:hypothetical protein